MSPRIRFFTLDEPFDEPFSEDKSGREKARRMGRAFHQLLPLASAVAAITAQLRVPLLSELNALATVAHAIVISAVLGDNCSASHSHLRRL